MSKTQNAEFLDKLPLAGALTGQDKEEWPEEIRKDFETNAFNGNVGSKLLQENERSRIWEIRLAPGERVPAHRHVLDYFWTAINAGTSRQRTFDGTTRVVSYTPGETRYYAFAEGEFLLHDLENIGDSELIFSTVEFLQSANKPLPL
jgi:hypothetical protein